MLDLPQIYESIDHVIDLIQDEKNVTAAFILGKIHTDLEVAIEKSKNPYEHN